MFSKNCVKFLFTVSKFSKITKASVSNSPTGSLYQTLVNVILKSDKTIEEKAALLNDLQKESFLQEKLTTMDIFFKDKVKSMENEIQSKDELLKEKITSKDKDIEHLTKEKERESLYKLHYQQLLTIRSVIEMFEKSFGKQNHLSRIENWKKYLENPENFKPFEETGLTEDGVSTQVDMLFKSHSADIHFLKTVEGFSLASKGFLTAEQEKIVKILIGNSPWKHLIEIV